MAGDRPSAPTARRASRSRPSRRRAAWPPAPRRCRGRRSRRPGRSSRCRGRARRSPGRRPSRRSPRPRRARRRPGPADAARRRGRAARPARSARRRRPGPGSHTSARWRDRRRGRRARRCRRRPAGPRGRSTVWPCGSSTSRLGVPELRLGDGADVRGGDVERLAQLRVESASSAALASVGIDRRASRAGRRWRRSGRSSSSTAASPPLDHVAFDRRHVDRLGRLEGPGADRGRGRPRPAPLEAPGPHRPVASRSFAVSCVDLGRAQLVGDAVGDEAGGAARRSPRAPRGRSRPACGRWRRGRRCRRRGRSAAPARPSP